MAPPHMLAVPRWLLALRSCQILLAIIILGLSAHGLYWIAFGSWGFAIFVSIATIIIACYSIFTQSIPSWNVAYNYWAIIALDIFGVIFWLSSMGALAATRSTFTVPTTIDDCVNNGYGGVCDKKRHLIKRDLVAGDGYLASMSAAAGLSALEMILFCVTLTIFGIHLSRYRASRTSDAQSEYKMERNPTGGTSYSPLFQQQHVQPQYEPVAPQQHMQSQYEPLAPQQHFAPPQGQYQQPLPPQQYYQQTAQGY